MIDRDKFEVKEVNLVTDMNTGAAWIQFKFYDKASCETHWQSVKFLGTGREDFFITYVCNTTPAKSAALLVTPLKSLAEGIEPSKARYVSKIK